MEQLLDRMAALESAMQQMQSERQATKHRIHRWRALSAVLALLVVIGLAPQTGHAALTLDERVAVLEAKLQYLTTTGTEMYITRANLHIVNGLSGGGTATTNGLGNLIIGYNELRPLNSNGTDPNARTGSHNLVLGYRSNYASYGGIVAGYQNEVRAPFASVTGGAENIASGYYSSVTGGVLNVASAKVSSVSGGYGNTASGAWSSVSGGASNQATVPEASVSGGLNNTASGVCASVSGGYVNTASYSHASVSGGHSNTASGESASVSGGILRPAAGEGNWAAGELFQAN